MSTVLIILAVIVGLFVLICLLALVASTSRRKFVSIEVSEVVS